MTPAKIDGRVNNGGARPGAGRKLQPSSRALRIMKKYIDFLYVQDFKLMAHLAYRPEEFADQVQFAGSEKDESTEGKQSQTRTGAYALDPLFKERLALLRFRLQKFLPDAPKEVELSGEMELNGLPPNILQVLIQQVYLSKSRQDSSSTQLPSAKDSVPAIPMSNGNGTSLMTAKLLETMANSVKTNGHAPSSLPPSTDQEKPKS